MKTTQNCGVETPQWIGFLAALARRYLLFCHGDGILQLFSDSNSNPQSMWLLKNCASIRPTMNFYRGIADSAVI
jgi:hypothetical protein